MDIIITAAGESKRFINAGHKIPKYLLEINKYTMLEHVLNMFNYDDRFHILLQNTHYKKYKVKLDSLKKIYKNIKYYFVKKHNLGPVYSIFLTKALNKINGPIIISYCDFFVEWNYAKFKRDIYGVDGAIPCFQGFHASSFTKTLYAYLKVNSKDKILDIREKKSFTKNKLAEPASTGIYYFKNFDIYNNYANQMIKKNKKVSKEFYVSLVYDQMIKDKLNILKTNVDKFICLGTPLDLDQFMFWLKYFNLKDNNNTKIYEQTNLIPLAGEGNRFQLNKYKVPKPFILVENKPMIVTSCESLPKSRDWVFLIQNKHLKKYPIQKYLSKSFNSKIIPVKSKTSGQLTTCYLAKDVIKKSKSLFISSCDYKLLYSDKKLIQLISNKEIDGIIWTTKLKNILYDDANNFAYCKVNQKKIITQIVEKKIISKNPENDPMVVGCFWYRDKNDFIVAAENSFNSKNQINNEYYVANSINYLIKNKKKIFVSFNVDYWISFGNPFELDIYHYWEELFLNKKNNLIAY